MVKKSDLVPLKVVLDELCVSAPTLWRARSSGIESFPRPTIIGRLVFWKRSDIEALEEALLRYEGRGAFERKREAARRIAVLKRTARVRPIARRRSASAQLDLFNVSD